MSKPVFVVSRRKVNEIDCFAALGRRISAHVCWKDGVTEVAKGVVVAVVCPAPGSGIESELLVREPGKDLRQFSEGYHYQLFADTITKLSIFEEHHFNDQLEPEPTS